MYVTPYLSLTPLLSLARQLVCLGEFRQGHPFVGLDVEVKTDRHPADPGPHHSALVLGAFRA
jgi:hypothetical protein